MTIELPAIIFIMVFFYWGVMINKHGIVLFILTLCAGCDTRSDVKTYFTPGPDCENHIVDELNKTHKIMHHKFSIFDGRRVVGGSYNWTENATRRNAENCDFFDLQNNNYINRFERLWNFYTDGR